MIFLNHPIAKKMHVNVAKCRKEVLSETQRYSTLECISYYKHTNLYHSILINAIYNGDESIAKYIIASGHGIRGTAEFAAVYNRLNIMKWIIESGETIDDQPLYRAIILGYEEMVRYLVSFSADTPIHALELAICNDHLGIVKYLMSVGVNIDHDRALVIAAESGKERMVEYFVSIGGDIHADDDRAFKCAIKWRHENVLRYLISLDNPNPTPISGHPDNIGYLTSKMFR